MKAITTTKAWNYETQHNNTNNKKNNNSIIYEMKTTVVSTSAIVKQNRQDFKLIPQDTYTDTLSFYDFITKQKKKEEERKKIK